MEAAGLGGILETGRVSWPPRHQGKLGEGRGLYRRLLVAGHPGTPKFLKGDDSLRRRIQVNEDGLNILGSISRLLPVVADNILTRAGKNREIAARWKNFLTVGFGDYSSRPIIHGQTFQPMKHYPKDKPNPTEVGSAT